MQSDQSSSNPPVQSAMQPAVKKKRRRNVFISIVLPLVLFVLLIGGIAWIAQNVSHWRKPTPPAKSSQPALVFENKDQKPEEHVVGASGHFDFQFSNTAGKPGKIGVSYVSCQCSSAKVAVFPAAEWGNSTSAKKGLLEKADWKCIKPYGPGVAVPPNGKGFLRIDWHDREQLPKAQQLVVKAWYQDDATGEAFETTIGAMLRLVEPIRCLPLKVNVGAIDDQGDIEAAFWCWSPFYDKLDLEILEKNPLFEYQVAPLDKAKRQDLVNKLIKANELNKTNDSTTVKGAMRVSVRIFAKKGDKHLDLGPFVRQIVLKANGKKYDKAGPLLTGRVQGPLTVGRKSDEGRIQLPTFLVDEGISHKVRITGPKEMQLSVVKSIPVKLVDVKLKRDEEPNSIRAVWYLTVTIPPGKASLGSLPDSAAVFLQTNAAPPRLIRIPVHGYAKRR